LVRKQQRGLLVVWALTQNTTREAQPVWELHLRMTNHFDPIEVEKEVYPEHVRWSSLPVIEGKVPIKVTGHSQRLGCGADALEVDYLSSSGTLNPTGCF
jgi:hypothetical protein